MQFRLKAVSGKTVAIASLVLAFVLVAGTAFASLTFNSTAITSDGALTLNPTGQPVTVNGNLTVTGTCTGCGGGTPGGSNTQIQFNNNGAFGASNNGVYVSTVPRWTFNANGSLTTPDQISSGFTIGVDESTLPAFVQGYTGSADLLITSARSFGTTGPAVGIIDYASANGGVALNLLTYGAGDSAAINADNIQTGNGSSNTYGLYIQQLGLSGATATGVPVGVWVSTFQALNGASIPNQGFAFYSQAQGGAATNAYSFWSDEQGVFRIKADNTFNGVYQAIPALYNPQFTKYTPGATNYERLVIGQWNSNVAEIGVQAGGTGTLRSLRMLAGTGLSVEDGNGNHVPVTASDVITAPVAVSGLPTCNSAAKGAHAFVTDANATTFNTTVAGGGSNNLPVFCDGTNWKIGG
jgi:hypothetical protein